VDSVLHNNGAVEISQCLDAGTRWINGGTLAGRDSARLRAQGVNTISFPSTTSWNVMKNVSIAVGIAVMLAACGGGGGDSTGSAPVATSSAIPAPTSTAVPTQPSSAPPVASSVTPVPIDQPVLAPAPYGGINISVTSEFIEFSQYQNKKLWFENALNLTVSGYRNYIWVEAAQPNGSATITGDSNTIIFRPSVNAKVTVTGAGNTFYVPIGASITITGSGLESSTIVNYVREADPK
jgi:hypothetical protein